ncbi:MULTISPECIES: XkdQ/YqbQ family protein [Clostridium]|uniref:YqbQ/XkdQ domain-containing protein n=1 Tax=Clostridium frigoriphilum TaxID=443253 RepID=A0ABU7UU79_9CLOT|nr:hypothetical protein [Clostridium sp. DSM 17811]MBU3098749.1 hypothetical protein [Clostridium sp. DSM 17811]
MIYTLMALDENGGWTDVLLKSNNVSWSSNSDTLSIELNFDSLFDLVEGTHIILKIDNKIAFTGVIVKKAKDKLTYKYICYDYAFYLNKSETIIQFNKVTASVAIEQLCAKFGVRCNCATINTVVSKIYKDMTLSAIIDDILENVTLEKGTKYIKEMISDILYIRVQKQYQIFPKFILSKDLIVNSSIENMKDKVVATGNDDTNTKILATVIDPINVKIYGGLQEVLTLDIASDVAHAKTIATNYLKLNNKIFYDTTLNIVVISGGEEIRANRSIGLSIKSMGLNGWYNIKSCTNTLSNGQYRASIVLEW